MVGPGAQDVKQHSLIAPDKPYDPLALPPTAGFLVWPEFRGRGIGTLLVRSFIRIAPSLGYKASLFNLVYDDNPGHVIYDRLGFNRIGIIPNARNGREEQIGREGGEPRKRVNAILYHMEFQ